jgi:hypothetical protein
LDPEAPQIRPPLGRGIPLALIQILNLEYPGDVEAEKLLVIRRPVSKILAVGMVGKDPGISQNKLAKFSGVSTSDINRWTPTLLAAGWEGQVTKRKEPDTPKKPKLGEPWKPGDPLPQSSKD